MARPTMTASLTTTNSATDPDDFKVVEQRSSSSLEGSKAAAPPVVKIWQKNCRSLKSDDRVYELERELIRSGDSWDAVLLSETWREEEKEFWSTTDENLFFGSGCADGRKGTGILLHAKWKKRVTQAVAVNPRLCYIDLKGAGYLRYAWSQPTFPIQHIPIMSMKHNLKQWKKFYGMRDKNEFQLCWELI